MFEGIMVKCRFLIFGYEYFKLFKSIFLEFFYFLVFNFSIVGCDIVFIIVDLVIYFVVNIYELIWFVFDWFCSVVGRGYRVMVI